ncbi:Protein DEFECTIVE IN MERISTEM SILENCING 3 [Linum perenne]
MASGSKIPPELQEFEKLRKGIRKHEDNLKSLRAHANRLDETMRNLDDVMAKHRTSDESEERKEMTEEKIRKEVRSSAAGIMLEFKTRYPEMALDLSVFRDTVGIVAALATVDSEDLICRTFNSVKTLEKYYKPAASISQIKTNKGVHGFATSMGMTVQGRFLVFCLEELIPFPGGLVDNDPQRRLDIPNPRLPNGKTPNGFLGFAVNLLNLENKGTSYVTFEGYGLRETLFYALFSHLHVYKTRADLRRAFPCITHGAVSLDGGMVEKPGIFTLGHAEDVAVRFPVVASSGVRNSFPAAYTEAESKLMRLMWEQLHLAATIRREQLLLGDLQTKLSRHW